MEKPKEEGAVEAPKEEAPQPTVEEPKEEAPEAPQIKPDDPTGEVEPQKIERPVRHIPFKTHKEVKQQLRDKTKEFEDLEKEVDELRKSPDATQADIDEEINKFAEENQIDKSVVKGLVGLAAKVHPQQPAMTPEQQQALDKASAFAEQQADKQEFESEWESNVLPMIKEDHPKASKKAIAQAKKHVDAAAHTPQLSTTPLTHVYAGEAGALKDILNPPSKKTAESSRVASSGETISFDDIKALPEEEKAEMIKNMDGETFQKFIASHEGEGEYELRREGKPIK